MLYIYELGWERTDVGEIRPFWTESISQADARSNGKWEASFPQRQTAAQLAAYANAEWELPYDTYEDGQQQELLANFNDIPLYSCPQATALEAAVEQD